MTKQPKLFKQQAAKFRCCQTSAFCSKDETLKVTKIPHKIKNLKYGEISTCHYICDVRNFASSHTFCHTKIGRHHLLPQQYHSSIQLPLLNSKQLYELKPHIDISAPREHHKQDMARCGMNSCMDASYKKEVFHTSVGMWEWDRYSFAAHSRALVDLPDSSSHMDRCEQLKEITHTLRTHPDDICSRTCDCHTEASWDTPSHRRTPRLLN